MYRYLSTFGILLIILSNNLIYAQQLNYQTHELEYDDLNRITKIHYQSGLVYEYEYDNLGNRLSKKTRIELPNDNYSVSLTGLTCIDSGDGVIDINANIKNRYVVNVESPQNNYSGVFDLDHTNDWSLILNQLDAGEYTITLTIQNVQEDMYQESYIINLDEPEPLEATSTRQANTTTSENGKVSADYNINIPIGTAPFFIEVNGDLVLETYDRDVVVNVSHGDTLAIRTSKPCEGIIEKNISIPSGFKLYPNPTKGIVTITLSSTNENAEPQLIQVFDINGRLVLEKQEEILTQVQLDISNLSSGEYFITIPSISETSFKVIKQ